MKDVLNECDTQMILSYLSDVLDEGDTQIMLSYLSNVLNECDTQTMLSYLRDILDECDTQLDVGEIVQVGQPGNFVGQCDNEGDGSKEPGAAHQHHADLGQLLVSSLS